MGDKKAEMVLSEMVLSETAQLQRAAFERVFELAKDKDMDVDKLERLIAMGERMDAKRKESAFIQALALLHAEVGELRITKDGRIRYEKDGRVMRDTPYATLENIDHAVRPILARHGFALSFDTTTGDGKAYTIKGFIRHREGHTESASIVLPLDTSAGKQGPQMAASTVSYGRRHLYKLLLNIVEEGEDDDGTAQPQGYISQAQADLLRACIAEVWTEDSKAVEARFLKWIGAPTFEAIELRAWERARGQVAKGARENLKDPHALEAVLLQMGVR